MAKRKRSKSKRRKKVRRSRSRPRQKASSQTQVSVPDVSTTEETAPESEDPQFERIGQVFNTKEIPRVSANTLRTFFNYLKENLDLPCLLTGIESMGYFSWEERFEFGYGSEAEYGRLRKRRGSYTDQYRLSEFDATLDVKWDILVNVQRVNDRKRFTIPLSELQAVDEASKNHQLLNDYTVWFVNW